MSNLAALIIRLEKRIIVIEKTLGIQPDKADLTHPKAQQQSDLRSTIELADLTKQGD